MIKTSTQTKVVKYLYDEATEIESIETEILTDNDLGAFYYELKELKDELSQIEEFPPRNVIDNVLNYSKSINLQAVVN